MNIYKNAIPGDFIIEANNLIDSIPYENSLFIFDSKESQIHKSIKNHLMNNTYFKDIIDDSYIVIRCVKATDKTISFYPHYDNYNDTYVIPLKLPKEEPFGDLFYKSNARGKPSNIWSSTLTKFLIQNFFSRIIIKKFFLKNFKKIHVQIGDILHFNGLTTLHFNDIVSDERRSLLIHSNNPFRYSKLNILIEWGGRLNIKMSAKSVGK